MNLKHSTSVLTTLVLILLVQACTEGQLVDPERPASVPQSAVWRGGLDGGNWVNCLEKDGILECAVYWQTGDLYSRQQFELCRSQNPSEWVVIPDGEGLSDVGVAEGMVWTPIAPATSFDSDGKIDGELTDKYAALFKQTKSERCPTD